MARYRAITEKDSRQDRLARLYREEIRRKDEQALMDILNSKSGRWWLMRHLDRTKVLTDTFTGNSSTFYNEGLRKGGLIILSDIARLGLSAVKLKQLAEIEYIEAQQKAREIVEEYLEEEQK